MENKEEVSTALEEFGHLSNGAIPTVLEQYLARIASTGVTLFPWTKVKPLLVHKLDLVLKEFHERAPVDNPTPCPNVEDVKFDDMHKRLLSSLEQFSGTPFTIQRLCELLTCPTKHYKKVDKFMRGIEKNLGVVTTVDSYGNRIVSESKLMVNGLDSSIDQTTVDRAAGNSSFTADQSAGSSPYAPTAPVNSPANVSMGGSGSWFSSLTSVVESPSSYPNWRASDATTHTTGDGLPTDGSWPVLVFEADDDSPPPTKRRFTGRQSQRPADRGDAVSTSPPVTVVAPLLGQLLSSSSYDSSGGDGSTSDGLSDGATADAEVISAKSEASNENAENEMPPAEKEVSVEKASVTEPVVVTLSNESTESQLLSGVKNSTTSPASDCDDIVASVTDSTVDSTKLESVLSDHKSSSSVADVDNVDAVSAAIPATDDLSTDSPEAKVLSDTASDVQPAASIAVDEKNVLAETATDIPPEAAGENHSIPTATAVEQNDAHSATSSNDDKQKVHSDVDSESVEVEVELAAGETDARASDHGGATPAAVADHELLTVSPSETPMETD